MLFTILLCLWYVLSGHNSVFLLGMGLLSCSLVTIACKYLFKDSYFALSWKFIIYLGWLLKEIVKSSWYVTTKIWAPKIILSPQFITLPHFNKNSLNTTILVYSITITPGTLTVLSTNANLYIHALTKNTAQSLSTLQANLNKYIQSNFDFEF